MNKMVYFVLSVSDSDEYIARNVFKKSLDMKYITNGV